MKRPVQVHKSKREMMFNLKRQTAHCSKVQPMADNDVLLLKRNTYDECWIVALLMDRLFLFRSGRVNVEP